MTTYYVGYSQRDIYKRRCNELGCACNSAVWKILSDVPGHVSNLTSLDLSRNFLGSKGVIALLDIIEGAAELRSLDLRDQKLSNEAVEVICARLRRHPSLVKLDMSNNPITLAVSSALLELVRQNSVLQYVYLENTFVRPSIVTAMEVQLEKNRQLASAASKVSPAAGGKPSGVSFIEPSAAEKSAFCTEGGAPRREQAVMSTPAGSGASAAASLHHEDSAHTAVLKNSPRQRCPAHELQEIFSSYSKAAGEFLFDVNPTNDVWRFCEARQYAFDDAQFSSNHYYLHRMARHTYGIAGWRRIGELYPDSTLFGTEEAATPPDSAIPHAALDRGDANVQPTCSSAVDNVMGSATAAAVGNRASSGVAQPHPASFFSYLPTDVPEGFTWSFTALMTVVKDMEALRTLLCASRTGVPEGGMRVQRGTACPGIYAMRVFIESRWRYLVVDDFFPVDKYGRLVFTKPSLGERAFWPCIFEKMLAKLYGGYHMLDANFDKHHAGIDGPNIRKPIAWRFLVQESPSPASEDVSHGGGDGSTAGGVDNSTDWDTAPDDSFIPQQVTKNCGRLLSRLTGGFCNSYQLHPREEMPGTMFEQLHRYLNVPLRSGDVQVVQGNSPGGQQRAPRKVSFFPGHRTSVGLSTGALDVSSCSTAAIAFSRDASRTTNGILPHCSYQIVRVSHTGGVRLLELRNPWCSTEKWTGDWADDSPLWRMNPEVAALLLVRGHGGRSTSSVDGRYFRCSTLGIGAARISLRRSLRAAALSETESSLKGEVSKASMGSLTRSSQNSAATRLDMQRSTFWMAYSDFLENFAWVHMCRTFGDEFHRQDVHGSWSRDSAGGNAWLPSWHMNPHYRLSSPYPAYMCLQLTRRDPNLRRTRGPVYGSEGVEGGIGLQLLHDTHYPLHCSPIALRAAQTDTTASSPFGSTQNIVTDHRRNDSGTKEELSGRNLDGTLRSSVAAFTTVLFSEMRQIGDHLSLEVVLDAGAEYWIVPTTYAPRVLEEFDLTVISTAPFMLREALEAQYWHQQTVTPEVLCSSPLAGTQQVGQKDDELAIMFDSHSRVAYDARVTLQTALQTSTMHPVHGALERLTNSRSTKLSSLPCRVVVTATVNHIAPDEFVADCGVHKAFGLLSSREGCVEGTGVLQLAIVPSELDAENRPTRIVGEVNSHATQTYVLDRGTVVETLIMPVPFNRVEHYTAICSLYPKLSSTQVEYRVWCTAPLLEVKRLPTWSKEEVVLCWDDVKGSGNYYEATRHPQVEVSKLRPLGRFTVSVQLVEHNTIDPAIMFTVIAKSEQPDEPLTGQLECYDVWFQSACVEGTYVEASFGLDERPPESLVVLPCLQPAGSTGKCVLTISSDTTDYCVRSLRVKSA